MATMKALNQKLYSREYNFLSHKYGGSVETILKGEPNGGFIPLYPKSNITKHKPSAGIKPGTIRISDIMNKTIQNK